MSLMLHRAGLLRPSLGLVDTVPEAFEIEDWSIASGDEQADVTINSLPGDGGEAITDIEYRLDGGSWVPSGSLSSFTIGGLTNGQTYDVQLRAVSSIGAGAASDTKSVTPEDDGPAYDSDAAAIWNAFTTPASEPRKVLISDCVVALKAAGLWSKLDVLYLFAAADAQAARINWKNPATFTASLVNSPNFSADSGFAGDGASSYVSSTFNPSAAGGNWQLNSASMGAWIVSGTGQQAPAGMASQNIGIIRTGSASSNHFSAVNSQNQVGGTAASDGFHVVTRPASATLRSYRNAVQVGSGTTTAAVVTNANLEFGRASSNFYGDGLIGAGFGGGGLSPTEVSAFYEILGDYLDAVGAL